MSHRNVPATKWREPSYNIKILDLSFLTIDGRDFLHMIPTLAPAILDTLKLSNVYGLGEDDMIAFLMLVAPTLTTLSLDNCPVTCTTGDSPQYFINEVMPLLTALYYMFIHSGPNIVTANSLALKPTYIDRSRLVLHEVLNYKHIVQALVQSKWGSVTCLTDRAGPYTEAREIAAENGMLLYLSCERGLEGS
jgi:hypothetical protein